MEALAPPERRRCVFVTEMYSVNRQVAIIKPKEPYVDWINSLPGVGEPCDINELNCDCTALLLPHFDNDDESLRYIKKIYGKIFEFELDSWSTDRNTWPKKRNFSMFREWFKVEFHSELFDIGKGNIEIEDY